MNIIYTCIFIKNIYTKCINFKTYIYNKRSIKNKKHITCLEFCIIIDISRYKEYKVSIKIHYHII